MQQQSSLISRVLSWFPGERQQCNLRVQIDQEVYPPFIHMDLMYDNPSVKPEINTALNISYLHSDGGTMFRVKMKGEQLSSCVFLAIILYTPITSKMVLKLLPLNRQ